VKISEFASTQHAQAIALTGDITNLHLIHSPVLTLGPRNQSPQQCRDADPPNRLCRAAQRWRLTAGMGSRKNWRAGLEIAFRRGEHPRCGGGDRLLPGAPLRRAAALESAGSALDHSAGVGWNGHQLSVPLPSHLQPAGDPGGAEAAGSDVCHRHHSRHPSPSSGGSNPVVRHPSALDR